ncbi:hypothetical protein GE061_002150 [Apolygus lucorum]|uniref:Uncharacterized protein n=1 Tax=Apolygus lucorum TaxID=248454 RepID=A0A8S9X8C4_APOLU|nr:hypothetical protein GE061_002150 [Apolygus lucorum]
MNEKSLKISAALKVPQPQPKFQVHILQREMLQMRMCAVTFLSNLPSICLSACLALVIMDPTEEVFLIDPISELTFNRDNKLPSNRQKGSNRSLPSQKNKEEAFTTLLEDIFNVAAQAAQEDFKNFLQRQPGTSAPAPTEGDQAPPAEGATEPAPAESAPAPAPAPADAPAPPPVEGAVTFLSNLPSICLSACLALVIMDPTEEVFLIDPISELTFNRGTLYYELREIQKGSHRSSRSEEMKEEASFSISRRKQHRRIWRISSSVNQEYPRRRLLQQAPTPPEEGAPAPAESAPAPAPAPADAPAPPPVEVTIGRNTSPRRT